MDTLNASHIPVESCNSWSYYSPVPNLNLTPEESKKGYMLGVDEAGRGPVLGSMVYAIAYTPVDYLDKLKEMGFADSKVLKPEQRDTLFEDIKQTDWIGWGVHACSPAEISESMFRRNKYNLNEIAHDTTINMIKEILSKGVNLTEIYVDTVGSPEKYQQKLSTIFPQISITVTKKADSLFPIVSAASICAKVTRDLSIQNWNFIESIEIDKEFGSGYPSDPQTVKWLKDNLNPIFGFPNIIRFSWSTVANLLESHGVQFDWGSENVHIEQSNTIDKFYSKTKGHQRDSIYQSLRLSHVVNF
ncbi:ribonuclease-like protein H2 large subunit [Globomyces pollinis-pini]|nr:ribonuclease-like protein H2 large subunit [Globomyces pollinis-pini]